MLSTLLRIRYVYPGSRLPDPKQQKKGGKTFFTNLLFHKIVNYFLFEQVQKNENILTQLLDPGFGRNLSRIRIQELKKHQIADPDPQHWVSVLCYLTETE